MIYLKTFVIKLNVLNICFEQPWLRYHINFLLGDICSKQSKKKKMRYLYGPFRINTLIILFGNPNIIPVKNTMIFNIACV